MACWRKRPNVLERRVADGILLLPVDGDDATLLGGTGGQVWELLTEARSTDELTEALGRVYTAAPGSIRSDVAALLVELERDGLVEREE